MLLDEVGREVIVLSESGERDFFLVVKMHVFFRIFFVKMCDFVCVIFFV